MGNFFENDLDGVTRLILIRHGRTQANKEARIGSLDAIPLDSVGREQAEKVAERLNEFPISTIYASPILRTKETAQIIASHLKIDVEIREELQEYNFGVISDHTFDEVRQQYPDVFKDMQGWIQMGAVQDRERPIIPEAEKFQEFESRLLNFRDHILDTHSGQVLAVVTHLSVIKGYMAMFFGGSVFERMNFLAHNTSLTIIDFCNRVPILVLFNDSRHLGLEIKYGKVVLL